MYLNYYKYYNINIHNLYLSRGLALIPNVTAQIPTVDIVRFGPKASRFCFMVVAQNASTRKGDQAII